MVDHIIFVHGYSESSLGAYFDFPKRVSDATNVPVKQIYLSAFDSLDDDVTIGDLADALESRVALLESQEGVAVGTSALIAHSTGALIARRWMVDRVLRNRARNRTPPDPKALAIPSHFISMAGANHGSSLAQTGKSWLGYVQKLWTHHILSVGKRVLTDLDYGSDFLLQLNRQWLIEMLPANRLVEAGALQGAGLSALFAFSMGGDSHGHDLGTSIFPPSAEPGSDNTVRISGANLNYTFMIADPEAQTIVALPTRPVPHHILRNYSHYGAETGVWGMIAHPDVPVDLVTQALGCTTAAGYDAIAQQWAADLATWTQADIGTPQNPGNANATLLFALHDRSGAPVEDASVVILDKGLMDATNATAASDDQTKQQTIENLQRVSQCIINEPIRNAVNPSSVSYYLNFDEYKKTAPHYYHIEAHSSSPLVEYRVIDYTGPTGNTDDAHVVRPNECTYVDVTMDRLSEKTYVIYPYDGKLDMRAWNPPVDPFPEGYIEPRP
ncbi:MAG: phospholipase [Candidatus Elarobacter sp.]